MKVKDHSGGDERTVLTGMIVDNVVAGKIAAKWNRQDGMFKSKWSNLVGMWCCKYFLKYQKAPGASIEAIFQSWASNGEKDKDTVALVDRFLSSLSDEYEELAAKQNPEYVIDLAGRHFQTVALSRLVEGIQGDLEFGEHEKALAKVSSFGKIELGEGAGIDVLEDQEAIRAVFEEETESLIEWPGDLAKFFGNAFERDAFLAFLGAEKSGKCIAGDMEILLEDGSLSTIEDIVLSEDSRRILSLNEETQRIEFVAVSDFWDNGKKPCWEMETRIGRRVITTGNHKYLTPDGWKILSDLKVGDFVAVPKKLDVFGGCRMDEDELKFLAYMLAEGCCVQLYCKKNGTRKKNGICSTFTNTDDELIEDFLGCCDRLGFGHRKDGISYHLHGATSLMRRLGIAGHSAKTKIIPAAVFSCPKDQVALFLRIFMSCDGYVLKSGEVGVGLANERMVRQIGHLLTRFGIVHRIKSGDSYNGEGKRFCHWTLSISDAENAQLFTNEINMMSYKRRPVTAVGLHKSFLDKFPHQVAGRFISELEHEFSSSPVPDSLGVGRGKRVRKNHALRAYMGTDQLGFIREQIAKKCPIMRKSFAKAAGTSTYDLYMNSHVLWDEVTSIEPVGDRRTYDLTVPPHHSFVANDCIVHNTWWLMEVAWRGMLQKKKVAFFEVGDMSERQIMKRMMVRATKHPFRPQKVQKPTKIEKNKETGEVTVEHEEIEFDDALSWGKAVKACEKITQGRTAPYLKLSCHPNSAIGMEGIRSILQGWERDGWGTPDILVIDYADNLEPPRVSGNNDFRHGTNLIWKQMRRASQELHCLLVTATQANSGAYERATLGKGSFSEDKRKNAHVTGMIGINVTKEEQEKGIRRLNWIVRREDEFNEYRCINIAHCLALSRPFVLSCF